MKQISIFGAGEMGQAMGKLLSRTHQISWYDKNRDRVKNQQPVEQIYGSDLVFMCVPSWALPELLAHIKPYLNSKSYLIGLSKGISPDGKTVFESLSETIGKNRCGILAGPMLAEELSGDKTTIGIAASRDEMSFHVLSAAFVNTALKLEYSADVKGVAVSSVLKNIYTISLGMAQASGWGLNAKSWLVTRIIKEMVIIVDFLGGQQATVLGPAGIGDLIATGFSDYSQNHRAGEQLASGGTEAIKSEGISSLPLMYKKISDKINSLPIFSMLYQTVVEKRDPHKALKQLFINGKQ